MKVKFYVLNHDSNYYTCFIISKDTQINSYLLGNSTSKDIQIAKVVPLSHFNFHLFLNELNCCPRFHNAVASNFKHSESYYVIQIVPTKHEYIDREW